MEKFLISVLCPAYNHENFIERMIKSVINQSYEKWELIIVDDCSSDNTFQIASMYANERIKVYKNESNLGVNYTLKNALNYSSGTVLMSLASDDELINDALEKIFEIYSKKDETEATCCNLRVIDEYSKYRNDYENSALPLLQHKNKIELLRDSFFLENVLYNPGATFRRYVLEDVLNDCFANITYQDYVLNIKTLIKYNIEIVDDYLVNYRILTTSLSNSGQLSKQINILEDFSVLNNFLLIKDVDLLKKIFAPEIKLYNISPHKDFIPFFLGMMATKSPHYSRKIWGYQMVCNYYNKDASAVFNTYGFEFKTLYNLARELVTPYIKKEKKKKFYEQLLKRIFWLKKIW